ncbi:MAG TPA: hypothetical protein VGJ41_12360 [Nocardioides sp.]
MVSRTLPALVVLLGTALGLAGCGGEDPVITSTTPSPTATPVLPRSGPLSALALVPESATTLTLTDWDAIRTRFGVPELTSDDPMSDRTAFWERVDAEAVVLAEGQLREDTSTYELDYGITQDDVDWEAHFTGPAGAGWVLSLRPDLPLDGVRDAIAHGPLRGSELEGHLVVSGAAAAGEETWASDPAWTGLTDPAAETAYFSRGCVDLADALGPEASVEDQDAVQEKHHVENLGDLAAWTIAYADGLATARIGRDRDDLIERAHLGDDWPAAGSIGFADGFTNMVDDPLSGRIGYNVVHPHAAAALTLAEELPFAVCNDYAPLDEPTGL